MKIFKPILMGFLAWTFAVSANETTTKAPQLFQISNVSGNEKIHDFSPWYLFHEAISFKKQIYFEGFPFQDHAESADHLDHYGPSKLWRYDGNTSTPFTNTSQDPSQWDLPTYLRASSTHLFFFAYNPQRGLKLFATDGHETRELSNTVENLTGNDHPPSDTLQNQPFLVGDLLVFPAMNAQEALKLFASDGKSVWPLSNTRGDISKSDCNLAEGGFDLIPANGQLFFRALNSEGAYKFYRTDGLNVIPLGDTTTDPRKTDDPYFVSSLGSSIIISANNSSGVRKIYRVQNDRLEQLVISGVGPEVIEAPDESHGFERKNFIDYQRKRLIRGMIGTENAVFAFDDDGITRMLAPAGSFILYNTSTDIFVTCVQGADCSLDKNGLYKMNDDGSLRLLVSDRYATFPKVTNDKLLAEVGSTTGSKLVVYRDGELKDVSGSYQGDINILGGFNKGIFFKAKNLEGGAKLFKLEADNSATQISNTRQNQKESDCIFPASLDWPIESGDALLLRACNRFGYQKLFILK